MQGMEVNEKEMKRVEAIILSMTKKERRNPNLIDGSRRRRIAAGSGTQVQDVNRLLKQFVEVKKLMKQFIFLFVLIFSGFLFSQDRNAEFFGGEKQLKKLIYSKINFDSTGIDENTTVELIFKIDKKGKVKNIDCKSFYPEAKTEFLKAAK